MSDVQVLQEQKDGLSLRRRRSPRALQQVKPIVLNTSCTCDGNISFTKLVKLISFVSYKVFSQYSKSVRSLFAFQLENDEGVVRHNTKLTNSFPLRSGLPPHKSIQLFWTPPAYTFVVMDNNMSSEDEILGDQVSNGAVVNNFCQYDHLKVVYDAYSPFLMISENGTLSGIFVDTFSLIVQKLGLQVSFIANDEPGVWGQRGENGSWNGMMKMLAEGSADISIAGKQVLTHTFSSQTNAI